MIDREAVKAQIRQAFADVESPPDWCLRGSNEGDDPYLLEQEFRGKGDWNSLDPQFLDQAPAGFGSALCFMSDEAFRFYLPAYLLADLDGQLCQAVPLYHLCRGLDDESRGERVNPRRYGERTWFEVARYRFSVFSQGQAAAIVAYLRYKLESNELAESEKQQIKQTLHNFWFQRAAEQAGGGVALTNAI